MEEKKKKRKKNYYFTQDTEDAIIEFNACTDYATRNKIYNERINFALFKLTQNIINTYKFPYMDGSTEDKQQECICHVLEQLNKFDKGKGKAYSYFGTAVLRYCINKNDKAYKRIVEKTDVNSVDEDKNIVIELNNKNQDTHNELFDEENYVIEYFLQYIIKHINKIARDPHEKLICEAVIELIQKRNEIEILAKKAILLYLRESTKKETPEITKMLKRLKIIYERLNKQYMDFGFISLNF